ncbi:MAG: EAL domain-containing protein, partial [Burkholderiaceae bacterium]|nr:EAL domain-containing protein [Burkholderiaceae bacterium]
TAVANPKHLAFLGLLIDACRQYGAKVCMEGIEDEAMLDALRPLQANLYQGYLFSKPVEIEALLGMFE